MVMAGEQTVRGEKLGIRLQTAIEVLGPHDRIDVIVRLAHKADLSSLDEMTAEERRRAMRTLLERHAQSSQLALRSYLQAHDGRHLRSLWLSNALAVNVPAAVVRELAQRPDVESVVLDAKVRIPVSSHAIRSRPATGTPQQ